MATIYTVDDERAIIEVYRDIFSIKNHEIIAEAFNGNEAVEKYKSMVMKPDVVIMDHRMPIKDGIETMKEILSENPLQCVVFVTADYVAAKNALLAGASSFVLKPFRMDNLFNSIETALMEREERKSKIRETLLGIVAQYRSSTSKELKSACQKIGEHVIDEYLRNQDTANANIDIVSNWACALMNLVGFDFMYEKEGDNKAQIKGTKCYWMEKYGVDPVFCSITKCILGRFAVKVGTEVKLGTRKTLMNQDECCLFEISI